MCTAPGTTTITLVVDDGPGRRAGACPTNLTTMTTTVTCDAAPSNQVAAAWVELTGPNGSNGLTGNVAIARAITEASAADGGANPCPTITINGGAPVQMNLRAAATTSLALRSVNTPPNKPALFPVSSCEYHAARGRDQRRGRRPVAAAAEGESDQDRRHRRHGLPPAEWQRHAELQRPEPERHRYAVPVRGRRRSGRGAESGPGASRRRLRLPRQPVPGQGRGTTAAGARGASAGTPGKPTCSRRAPRCSPRLPGS